MCERCDLDGIDYDPWDDADYLHDKQREEKALPDEA